ncbi:exo-alpha-sialidase [Algoriphagus lutimaris]|uniref:sialidase family protein n=1 Tax=Algoriphagus lutimaris TaxID=613197 RepID=UPI00196A322C|nr:sialidase family protein [Algoriphagus lutimaris]MBN3520268.1 exo-alpha-sialidase [Algoriphagus lutimaris]
MPYLLSLFLFATFSSVLFPKERVEVKILKSEFIYETAPFPSCHASTLVETPEGILASWFGGQYERHPDVSIYTSMLKDDTWSTPVLVADGIENKDFRNPTWNPVLYRNPDSGQIVLFYKEGPNPREWWGLYKTSDDGGKNWSKAIQIPPGMLGPVKNKPVALPNGTILYGSSFETNGIWSMHVETTNQNIENWKKIEIDNGSFHAIQPTILSYPNGKLQLLARTQEDVIGSTWSIDGGKTWSTVESTGLIHNNSGIDAVTLKSGIQLLLCNPIKDGRNKLSLLMSMDGINWEEIHVLEDQPKGEFSYPAIIQAKDGTVHLTYTYNREKVKYVALTLE